MIISYNWLKEYFKKLPNPEKLAEVINKKAFEVEGLEEKDGDYIFVFFQTGHMIHFPIME